MVSCEKIKGVALDIKSEYEKEVRKSKEDSPSPEDVGDKNSSIPRPKPQVISGNITQNQLESSDRAMAEYLSLVNEIPKLLIKVHDEPTAFEVQIFRQQG